MKSRTKFSNDVAAFALIDMTELRGTWDLSSTLLRNLHQCTSFCKFAKGTFHEAKFCDYMLGLDHQRALNDATAYLLANPAGRVSGSLSISKVSTGLREGSPQAELTLSFLTDPVTLKARRGFDNGRHRATALFDAGATGQIPVLDLP
ncbi:hypothetical protein BJQ94_13775 [Cryobacterium sp. SO2]|uniref:hypothetical protein n=1 Tax=Cryobacterium sp. SO2 TaxID=1897060 RepID=UPI00223DEDC1|nr:hypothetical protein [Cryobacterium sp. SO2]WEO76427.1 hypothetical protein BJQ94_13775 [Cryobacterium sp. SO2]